MMKKSDVEGPPVALTIAGLDPSGAAGIVADIRTFVSHGCFATAAITAITFQNTTGVFGAVHQTAETVRAQLVPILDDFTLACVKTGMLPTREIVVEVARLFRERELPAPVVDPVMKSTSGHELINGDAVNCLVSELLPLARVVTPNIPEAERLTGLSVTDEAEMRHAAKMIRDLGARAVLVKGGHLGKQRAGGGKQEAVGRKQGLEADEARRTLPGEAIDVLDDEGLVTVFRAELIGGGEVHGSGCALSAAIAACLGKGLTLEDSVRQAKLYVTEAIKNSPRIGHGARPLM
jgi:hydroxymethylpyrimidine kinase/phosphomethylpyrimidine kinase